MGIQLQHHISKFLLCLNNSNLLGTTTKIRIQQIQNNLWSTTNILQHPNLIIDGKNKYSTNFKIIQLLQYLNMQIDAHYSIMLPHTITHTAYPLEKLLNKHNSYNIIKKQLKIKNILYLDQLTTMDNSTLLKWEHLSPRIGYLPKGKIPTWFKYLENTLIENSVTRKLIQQPVLTSNNYFSYTTGHFSKKHKPWLITNNNNNSITIGKARLFNAQLNTISITHWIHNIDYTHIEYYPTPSLTCSPCSGCNLNSNRIKNQCTFDISATLSTQF